MEIFDQHNHSSFSFDSETTLAEKCRGAVAKGLAGFCMTEHFSVDDLDVSYGYLDYQAYHREIEICRDRYGDRLWIGRGLEIGKPHLDKCRGELERQTAGMELDLIIASVHNIGSKKMRLFLQGKSREEVYRAYFQEMLAMVRTADFDVAGHLDLAKRYAFKELGNYALAEFQDLLQDILREIVRRGKGIELNTSGWRNSVGEPYPSLEVLRLYRQLGGRYITIGSDAHDVENMAGDFERAAQLLRSAGFTAYYRYEKRKAYPVSLLPGL